MNATHLSPRLLVILTICLVAMALPAAPVQAADGASITLSPSWGAPGTELTVYGSNFTADTWVDVYYFLDTTDDIPMAEVKADGGGDFMVTFTVPESFKGYHTVLAAELEGKSAYKNFEVRPRLTVSSEEGAVSTNVTVEGRGFAKDETNIELRYYLDSDYEIIAQSIVADAKGSWERSFQIPPSSKGSHKIDAKGDTSSLTAVKDAVFVVVPVISLDTSSGSSGDTITMTGSGFYVSERDIEIVFDDDVVTTEIIRADARGSWEASFEVPQRSRGTYSVTAQGEWTRKADLTALTFQVKPGILLSPGEGHVGTELTVTGRGFALNKDLVVMYDDIEIATAESDPEGSFQISFLVPESQRGAHNVTSEDETGNNATATFIMESDPPGTPEPASPRDGARSGVIGWVRPIFEWSEISDDSGVRYTLQIAASGNVTAAGFANPRASITDIVGTNYTLLKKDALPYGTYYWIVRAVDRAGNAGNWSAAYSFHAGVLPLWAFILIIVGAVAVTGTLIYFFIIRKRIYYY